MDNGRGVVGSSIGERVAFFVAESRKIRVEIWKIYPQLLIINLGEKFDRQLARNFRYN